jgi:hypothetical protein
MGQAAGALLRPELSREGAVGRLRRAAGLWKHLKPTGEVLHPHDRLINCSYTNNGGKGQNARPGEP